MSLELKKGSALSRVHSSLYGEFFSAKDDPLPALHFVQAHSSLSVQDMRQISPTMRCIVNTCFFHNGLEQKAKDICLVHVDEQENQGTKLHRMLRRPAAGTSTVGMVRPCPAALDGLQQADQAWAALQWG